MTGEWSLARVGQCGARRCRTTNRINRHGRVGVEPDSGVACGADCGQDNRTGGRGRHTTRRSHVTGSQGKTSNRRVVTRKCVTVGGWDSTADR